MVSSLKSSSVLEDSWILLRFGIRFLHVSEKAARSHLGERLQDGFCPSGPHPSILEAGTVALSLARLPTRKFRVLLIRC